MLVRLMPDTKYLVCVSTEYKNEVNSHRMDRQTLTEERDMVESCIKVEMSDSVARDLLLKFEHTEHHRYMRLALQIECFTDSPRYVIFRHCKIKSILVTDV